MSVSRIFRGGEPPRMAVFVNDDPTALLLSVRTLGFTCSSYEHIYILQRISILIVLTFFYISLLNLNFSK